MMHSILWQFNTVRGDYQMEAVVQITAQLAMTSRGI